MRFYRILDEGTNTGESPTVTITSPTDGNVLSEVITVSVTTSSSYPNVTTKLYVDGQEMLPGANGTNYLINTCEWPNGPHVFFATARALSGFPGPNGHLGILVGRSVSPYVPVTFSNLISRIAFSQPFFEPSLGQTQEVTASFAANCNWTLQIVDESSNVVRTATGSGNLMTFDWDGTGDGETNIPDGVYHYMISAETNGLPDEFLTNGSGGSGGSPPLPDFAFSHSPELWAMSADGNDAVPLALYPPGFNTNGLTIFSATPSQVRAARASFVRTVSVENKDASPAYSGPSGQDSTAPSRPPTDPVKNTVNTYAIAYFDYPDGRTLGVPGNGIPYPLTQPMDIEGSTASEPMDSLWDGGSTALSMKVTFGAKGWKLIFDKHDDDLFVQELRRNDQGYGGGELFTEATLGVFLCHGDYGTDPDYSAGSSGSQETYFISGNPNEIGDNAWMRLCQFGFGGNLKWMVAGSCFSLTDPNYGSMSRVGAIPLKTTHLLCGATTETLADSDVYYNLGNNLLGIGTTTPETVVQAWFDAGHTTFAGSTSTNLPSPIIFRVTGYSECFGDTIATNTAPSSPSSAPRNLIKQDFQAYP